MRDLIKELKENEKAFGRMDVELQDKAKKIGGKHFLLLSSKKGKVSWMDGHWSFDAPERIYRLEPDYTEEPEVIELDIRPRSDLHEALMIKCSSMSYFYTNAPALCPKKGYRFVGYRYKGMQYPYKNPTVYTSPTMGNTCTVLTDNVTVLFPVAAVYERAK